MKKLGIRGVVLLVVVFAFAVPVFASLPTQASGYTEVTAWSVDSYGNLVAEVSWTGTLEGTLAHTFSEGRADMGVFDGCIAEASLCGTLELLIVRTKGDQSVPGFEGNWVILSGSGGLQSLRGEGTFTLSSFDPLGGPYEGNIHFDPD
jgi:hypothetical protein